MHVPFMHAGNTISWLGRSAHLIAIPINVQVCLAAYIVPVMYSFLEPVRHPVGHLYQGSNASSDPGELRPLPLSARGRQGCKPLHFTSFHRTVHAVVHCTKPVGKPFPGMWTLTGSCPHFMKGLPSPGLPGDWEQSCLMRSICMQLLTRPATSIWDLRTSCDTLSE